MSRAKGKHQKGKPQPPPPHKHTLVFAGMNGKMSVYQCTGCAYREAVKDTRSR